MDPAAIGALLAAAPHPSLAIDRNERILAANAEARKLLGQELSGRHFITALRQPDLVEAVELCMDDNAPRLVSYLSGHTNADATYDVHVQRTSDANAVLLSFQDVTQMTQAGQMRRDFVANVSHELRTPLTSLMGFIETLQGPAKDDPAARERFLGIMGSEAERMNRLVGDLLSLSRVEADERVRPTTRVDVAGLLSTTIRNLAPLAEEAGVTLQVDLPDAALLVQGDGDQLVQVFTNLIENAIKYGGDGQRVKIQAEVSAPEPSLRAPGIRVVVTDFGPGIAPEHLPRLTERFYRADNHRSRAMGGTGLGLAIVKHILSRHRGRLKITSEPGQGAQFSVSLPLDRG